MIVILKGIAMESSLPKTPTHNREPLGTLSICRVFQKFAKASYKYNWKLYYIELYLYG